MLKVRTPEGGFIKSSRELSTEMGVLAQSLPGIFAVENVKDAHLCENGAINLIGSLLTLLYAEELRQPLTAAGLQAASILTKPYSVDTDVPINLNQTNVGTGTVLATHTLNFTSMLGMTIGGPYTGLIGWKRYTGNFKPVRIFHDRKLNHPEDYEPYTPIILKPADLYEYEEVHKQVEDLYKKLYHQYVNKVRWEKHALNIYMSDIFIHLCNQLKIPLDVNQFHFVRNLNFMGF